MSTYLQRLVATTTELILQKCQLQDDIKILQKDLSEIEEMDSNVRDYLIKNGTDTDFADSDPDEDWHNRLSALRAEIRELKHTNAELKLEVEKNNERQTPETEDQHNTIRELRRKVKKLEKEYEGLRDDMQNLVGMLTLLEEPYRHPLLGLDMDLEVAEKIRDMMDKYDLIGSRPPENTWEDEDEEES